MRNLSIHSTEKGQEKMKNELMNLIERMLGELDEKEIKRIFAFVHRIWIQKGAN